MRLEIWTIDEIYHVYDLDEWVVVYEQSPFGGDSALALAHRETRNLVIFPWTSIVRVAYPDARELKTIMEGTS